MTHALSSTTTAAPHPDALFTPLPDGAVILHLETKAQFKLNETGARVWALLAQGLELSEVSRRLSAEYDVSEARAGESVTALVNALAEAQLVRVGAEAET